MRQWVQGRLVLRGECRVWGTGTLCSGRQGSLTSPGVVRNLPTGEVEVIAEGEEEEVRRFFEEVKKGPASAHVTSFTEEWLPFSGLYHDFRVGY